MWMEQSNSGAMKHALVILNDNQGSYISRTSQLISTCMYKLPCRNAILMGEKRRKKIYNKTMCFYYFFDSWSDTILERDTCTEVRWF